MHLSKSKKGLLAALLTGAMLLTCNTGFLYADEIPADAVKAVNAEPTASESTSEAVTILKDGEEPKQLEINQGFSLHVKKDHLLEDASPTYMSNFVAGKATIMALPVNAADVNAAKEAVKNWELYYVKADNDGNDEGDPIQTWKGNDEKDFFFKNFYDKDSNTVSGQMMAYARTGASGFSAGKYNFYLKDGENVIAQSKNVDFYETNPLNILAVPVTAYYGQANKPYDGKDNFGAPSVGSFECGENWNGVIDKVKTYLMDVYPVATVSIDEGNVFDASDSSYDMCTDEGQKKLWDEVSKLQVRDKETGKDKYDIILAFVMYRQDASGNGQGYTYGKPTNIITLMDKDMLPTVAHEIAHCYNVGDEYDGGSYNYRVNDVPLGYNSNGRDKVDGNPVPSTTSYMHKYVSSVYSDSNVDKYPWLSSSQFKTKRAGDSVADGKTKDAINGDGNGSVIDLELHPFIFSADDGNGEFVSFAKTDSEVFPTISYMGSGYSGDKGYYFTTSVIWDHLFNEFMKKEKKEDSNAEAASLFAEGDESDEDLEQYYDEECRFGESKLIEVSGEIDYKEKAEETSVSECIVDPMFSYQGDLEFIDYLDLDGDDKGIDDKDLFVFAALDKDGKVITSPVDKEKSIVTFYGGNINTAVNVDPGTIKEDDPASDKRIQNFCSFEFNAEFPEGTSAFAIMNYTDYKEDGEYKEKDGKTLWFKPVPPQEIDGQITDVKNTKEEMTVKWECAAFDKDDKATTDNLYTMIYYAPQGDDGEVYFMEDGFYDAKDNEPGMYNFKVSENGMATYSFKPTDYFEAEDITDKAYVWVKISDGVNGLDLYSDEYVKPDQEQREELVTKEAAAEEKTQVLGDSLKVKADGKNFAVTGLENAVGEQKLTVNAGAKFVSDAFKTLDLSKVTVSVNGAAGDPKLVKKLLKLKAKKGTITVKPHKTDASYTFMIPLNEDKCTLVLKVVNIGFDKALKKKNITALTGEGSVVSANLVKMNGKTAKTDDPSEFLSAKWFIDGKTEVKSGEAAVTSKKGFKIEVSKDNRTLTVSNPGELKKGSVKITANVNGKKYTTSIKAKVK